MKKYSIVALCFMILSCGVNNTKVTTEKGLYEVLTQESTGGASIRFFEILSEPREIKMLQNDENLKNKVSFTDIQNSNFVILNMGEKSTGGFAIGVDSVSETAKNIIIKVKESSPKEGTMVSQALTYPFCVVKINSKKEIIIK